MAYNQSFATDSLGKPVETFNVAHAVSSRQRLSITLTNTTQNDLSEMPIFPGFMGKSVFDDAKYGDNSGQGVDVVFKADGFANIAEFCKYMERARVAINGCRIYSSDVANFSGDFVHKVKYAYGTDSKTAKQPLDTYRVALGNGYSNDMKIPEDKLVWRLWYGLSIFISRLKAGSTMKFDFEIIGQDTSSEVAPLSSSVI